MELVNALMKFAQAIHNFICVYIVIIKISTKRVKIQLPPPRLQTFKFLLMWLQTFVGFTHDWVMDLNDGHLVV